MTIDLQKTLCLAESIYNQFLGADELPTSIQKLIGLAPDIPDVGTVRTTEHGFVTVERSTPSPLKSLPDGSDGFLS